MKIEISGDFLKAEDLKGGEIIEIVDAGTQAEITNPEGKTRTVLNFGVKLSSGEEKTFTPNKTNLRLFVSKWGAESNDWINKSFKVSLVKVNVFGAIKDSIVAEPLGPDVEGKPVEIVKI